MKTTTEKPIVPASTRPVRRPQLVTRSRSKPVRTKSPAALAWPASPEIDGFRWTLGPDASASH